MFDRLKSILSKVDADYADIRYEIKKDTKIVFNGKELTEIDSNSTDGYVLRVLKNGGLSSVAFTKSMDADDAIKDSIVNAILISKNIEKPVELAKTDILEDTFIPNLNEDPREVSIDEKLEITRKYNNIPLKYDMIVTTNVGYTEIIREKYFLSTEGSKIREDLVTTRIRGTITSSDGEILQNIRVGIGGSNGFAVIRCKEEEFEKRTSIVLDLLKAKPVDGGIYNVILNPDLAGVFTHEAFGHFSEADIIEDCPSIREKMQIGTKLGNDIVSIIDDATMPDQLGFYKFDDEGVKVRPTQLMKNGVLVGRLHSRRTAASFGEPLSGHGVAEDYRFPPIIRMGNIFIEPGADNFDNLLTRLKDGLYLLDAKGGQTSGENFTFGAQYGYIIKNDKLDKLIRDINISGNLYHTLQNIVAVGDDLELSRVGGCGKGQLNIRSCSGAPHILVNDVVVGGV
ncbi:TldD/PmbA family protein [candidate division WOR-3 bacterium]|nr:TldD/PmbA family protein [candidate division WOR-3 bacterium]